MADAIHDPQTPEPAPPPRRALVVLGMHRSGTSAVAGCLQRLGVEFGPRLMPPTSANERGYYEHIDVVNLHDRLLMALDRGWESTKPWPAGWWNDEARAGRYRAELLALLRRDFGAAPLWGIKDPRLCLLLPWWRPLWPLLGTKPVFVVVVRDPREVAASLARREGVSRTRAYLLWREHLRAAERETRGCERCFVGFEDFLKDWRGALAPLGEFIGPGWTATLAAGAAASEAFLDASLRHPPVPTAGREPLPAWLEEDAARMSALCAPEGRGLAGRGFSPPQVEGFTTDLPAEESVADQLSDQAVELAAARKLARWYESEWHKASVRASRSTTPPRRRADQVRADQSPRVINESNNSILRNNKLSYTRKTVAKWLRDLAARIGK